MVWFQLWGGDGFDLLDKGNGLISVAEGKKLKHGGAAAITRLFTRSQSNFFAVGETG